MLDKDKTFFKDLCKYHISGQLKVAPEHTSDKVLSLMRKSTHKVYEEFSEEYKKINFEFFCKAYLTNDAKRTILKMQSMLDNNL